MSSLDTDYVGSASGSTNWNQSNQNTEFFILDRHIDKEEKNMKKGANICITMRKNAANAGGR